MPAPQPLEFRVLGPVEAVAGDRDVPLGGPKQRGVLALLLLRAGQVVSADELVMALWGPDAPPTAQKALQGHVSRLRQELQQFEGEGWTGGALRTQRPGYVLHIDEEQLDLRRFERLTQSGRAALSGGDPETAAQRLREALGLWRGPALADLRSEPFAEGMAERLEDARIAALETRIEADLALGNHGAVLGELQPLIDQHPLRERLRELQMLALYRGGRQADALAAYADARRLFAEELGIEPSTGLTALQQRILEHDRTLELAEGEARRPGAGPPRTRQRRRRLAVALAALAALAIAGALALRSGDGEAPPATPPPSPKVVANSVVRISMATSRVEQVFRVGADPDRLVVDRGAVWTVNPGDPSVSRVDLRTGEVRPVRGMGGVRGIFELTSDPMGGLWLSALDDGVLELDPERFDVRGRFRFTRPVEGLVVDGGMLWATQPGTDRAGNGSVVQLNPPSRRPAKEYEVGRTPIFLTAGFGRIWAANYDSDTISVIDPSQPTPETVTAGDGPLGIAAGEGSIWVVAYSDRELVRIDPETLKVIARIPVGNGALGVAVGEGSVWVTNREDGTVTRIDPRSNLVVETVTLGLAPHGVAVGDGAAWVTVRANPYGPG